MLGTLKGRIFLIVVLVVGLITGFVMLFSQRHIEDAMLSAEERSTTNVLDLVTVDVDSRHQNLIRERLTTITAQRQRLEELGGIVRATLAQVAALGDDGGTMDSAAAQAAALTWIDEFRPAPGLYALVIGPDRTALAAGNPALVGTDVGAYRDFKNRGIVAAVREDVRGTDGAFLTFRFPAAEHGGTESKFGYFFLFPQWEWIVAVTADIADIEGEAARRHEEIVAGLTETLGRVRIGESGHVFIFRGDGSVVVPPPSGYDGVLDKVNQHTGQPLRDDLVATVAMEDPLVVFQDGPNSEAWQFRVSYFRPLDWHIVATASIDELHAPAQNLVRQQGAIFLGVLILALGLAYAFAGHIARPLIRLAEHARRLPERDLLADTADTSPIAEMPRRHRDEVGHLAKAFLYMEDQLRLNVARLMEATAHSERIESELNIARDIQLGLLPEQAPALAETRKIDLKARMLTAKEVGGDLYDYFAVDKDRICFAVGDVSGKGVPAALFMAITKTLLRAAAEIHEEPGDIMRQVNDGLVDNNPNMMFVTLFVAILDVRSGQLSYACGGHPPPILLAADGEARTLDGRSGPACGVAPDFEYQGFTVELEPGDTVIGYTDGVTEAMNAADQEYGTEPLMAAVERARSESVEHLTDAVISDVQSFAGKAPQSDDIVVLALRFVSRSRPEQPGTKPTMEAVSDAVRS